MKKLFTIVLVGLAALVLSQFDAMGMMRKMKSSPVMLLQVPDVKKDLKTTGDQNKKLAAIQKEFQKKSQEIGNSARSGDPSAMGTMDEEMDKASKASLEVLEPGQVQRFRQIQYQIWGAVSLYEPDVQKELQLSPEQTGKVDEWRQGESSRAMQAMQGTRGGKDTQKKMKEMRETDEKTLLAILTPEQATKFKEMQGPPSSAAKKLRDMGF